MYIGLRRGTVSPVGLFFVLTSGSFWRPDPRRARWRQTRVAQAKQAGIGFSDMAGMKYMYIGYLQLAPLTEKGNCGCAATGFAHPLVAANPGAAG